MLPQRIRCKKKHILVENITTDQSQFCCAIAVPNTPTPPAAVGGQIYAQRERPVSERTPDHPCRIRTDRGGEA
jgi:hypothetical protein